jgi:hypothetical protein
VVAAPALVFVDRHRVDYTNSQIPNPKPQWELRRPRPSTALVAP